MENLINHSKWMPHVFFGLVAFLTFGCDKEEDNALRVPEQFPTIQLAVDAAKPGDRIHVAPGSYPGSVHIIGADKSNLQIIAKGSPGSVELVGDHMAMTRMDRGGFYLKEVSGVVITGFKVRDFGMGPLSAMGESFFLEDAHNNRIEKNQMTASDMMGITLGNSGHNTVVNNTIFLNDIDVEGRVGTGCGVHIEGAKAESNLIQNNEIWGNPLSGIMIRNAGTGNTVKDNIFRDGALWGVTNRSTHGTIIENNQIYGHQGFKVSSKPNAPWVTADQLQKGVGIDIATSKNLRVVGNKLSNNKTINIEYDGLNQETNIFERNE